MQALTVDRNGQPFGILICLAAAQVSEPRLACYLEMPNARIVVVGHDSRPEAPNLIRLPAWRIPYLGAPERWTAALSWFRGLRSLDLGSLDCVLSFELYNPTSLQAGRLARRLRVPHVVTVAEVLVHNPLFSLPPWRQVTHAVRDSADAFLCSVETSREFAVAKGCPSGRCHVINPGIDLRRFTPRRGGRSEDPALLFVGELRPDKGIRDVIAAAESARTHVPDLRLVIVGDGPLRKEVEALSRRLSFIDYRGRVARAELPDIYRAARAFALAPSSRPFWAEQFGFASVEAMASGLPVVITDCGAVRDVVPSWNPICSQGDRLALTAGILAAFGPPGDDWGARNRQIAETRFDIHTQAEHIRRWLDTEVVHHP